MQTGLKNSSFYKCFPSWSFKIEMLVSAAEELSENRAMSSGQSSLLVSIFEITETGKVL